MQRYNLFNQIHKALRSLLYQTALKVQQTNYSNSVQRAETVDQVQLVLTMFEGHAHTEDSFILPKIEAYEPSVADLFEKEHVEDMALGQRVADILGRLQSEKDQPVEQTGLQLSIAFVDFMVFNLQHMKKEEEVLNALLWRYYSDEELRAISRSILGHLKPEQIAVASKWMMRGLSDEEIFSWLREMKQQAPAPAFQFLLGVGESELEESRWNSIKQQLDSQLMVA